MRYLAAVSIVVTLLSAALLMASIGQPDTRVPTMQGYKLATEPRPFVFPRDHGAHPDYAIEWWYFTGSLKAENGDRYGYFLTFFRVGIDPDTTDRKSSWAVGDVLFAHASITDVRNKRFVYEQKLVRPAMGMGNYSTNSFDIKVQDWSGFTENSEIFRLRAFLNSNYGLSLRLTPLRKPVLNGNQGLSQKGKNRGNANYYYSLTRLYTDGTLTVGGKPVKVSGMSWMDREWGTSQLDPESEGWDWFSLRLTDGRDLMIYVLRDRSGRITRYSSATFVERDGKASVTLKPGDFDIKVRSTWTSPHSGGVYPASWTISVPSRKLKLSVQPALPDQELSTEGTAGVTYWEGLVTGTGTSGDRKVSLDGYIELTGYAPQASGPRSLK